MKLTELKRHAYNNAGNSSGTWVFHVWGKDRVGCRYSRGKKTFKFTVTPTGHYEEGSFYNVDENTLIQLLGEAYDQ